MNELIRRRAQPRYQMVSNGKGRSKLVTVTREAGDKNDTKEAKNDDQQSKQRD